MRIAGREREGGFSLLEVMIGGAIFAVALVGFFSATTHIIKANRYSMKLSRMTSIAEWKMEEVKRLGAREQVMGVGSFGFEYLVDTSGYLATMYDDGTNGDASSGDGIYTNQDTIEGITRTWWLEPYPTGSFSNPTALRLVKVTVRCTWVDGLGEEREAQLESLINRRQFVQ